MASVQNNSSDVDPQLLGATHQKVRAHLVVSGETFLSIVLCYGLLICYILIMYVVILVLGGFRGANANVPWWLTIIALLVIGPTSIPLHHWLRRSVNQLVYGQYDDPYALLTQLNQHIDAENPSGALLPTLANTLAATLKLPFVAIETTVSGSPQVAIYGVPPPHVEQINVPLIYRTTMLGTVRVCSRHPHEQLSADDLRLLGDLARQVAITLHAAQLSDALQASREQLVLAREEERRRIRRDLHDSLGPTLASLHLQLSALRHHVGHSPDAERLIDELRGDVRAATAEIRRLVYDLRPPMLDEFGLLGALRNLELTSDGVEHSIEAPAALPPLPAAVEVAIYRIASEALHNIVRHAHATRCTISIMLNQATLTLTVTDNGCGLPTNYLAGVGHQSMYERAAELGGSVTILPAPTGGTRVTATFRLKEVHDD